MDDQKQTSDENWQGSKQYAYEQFQLFRKFINFIKELDDHAKWIKLTTDEKEYLAECVFNHNYEAIKRWKRLNAARLEAARILRVRAGTRQYFWLKKQGKI